MLSWVETLGNLVEVNAFRMWGRCKLQQPENGITSR